MRYSYFFLHRSVCPSNQKDRMSPTSRTTVVAFAPLHRVAAIKMHIIKERGT
jgi:hypothetical protein